MNQETIKACVPIVTLGGIGVGVGSISSFLIDQVTNKTLLLSSMGIFIIGGCLSIVSAFIIFMENGVFKKFPTFLIFATMFFYVLGSIGLISSFYHLV